MKPGIIALIVIGSALVISGGVIFTVGISKSVSTPKEEKTYVLEQDFTGFEIETNTSNLEFRVSNDGSKKVVASYTDKFYHTVDVTNNKLVIKQVDERAWYEKIFSFNVWNMSAIVYLPSSHYETLSINGSTGNIYIENEFSFDNVEIKGSTGDVTFKANATESLNVEMSTGDVSLENIESKALKVTVSTGDVKMKNIHVDGNVSITSSTGYKELNNVTGKNLDLVSSTGDVKLINSVFDENIKIEARTGSIYLEDSDAETLNIKTSTGNVKGTVLHEHIFIAKSKTGDVNVPETTTGGVCKIETDTGKIDIRIKA